MSEPLLVDVSLAQGAVLGVMLCALIASAAWSRLVGRRLDARAARAAAAVLRPADPGTRAPAELRALPRSRQLELLTGLAASIGGGERSRLRRVADELGLVDRAERWCRCRPWWKRLRGARSLTLLGGGDHVVGPMLADRRPEVRAQAAEWAADHPSPEVVSRLLTMLGDPEALCRFSAKDSLLRIGRAACGPLASFLSEARADEREDALEIAVGIAEPGLLGSALSLCRHDHAGTRARAATLAGAIGGEAAVEALTDLLADRDPAPRAAAARALGKLGHWPVAPQLASLLGDPSWEVRQAAALALRAIGAPGSLMLRRSRSDDDRFARDMARQVLDIPTADQAVVAP